MKTNLICFVRFGSVQLEWFARVFTTAEHRVLVYARISFSISLRRAKAMEMRTYVQAPSISRPPQPPTQAHGHTDHFVVKFTFTLWLSSCTRIMLEHNTLCLRLLMCWRFVTHLKFTIGKYRKKSIVKVAGDGLCIIIFSFNEFFQLQLSKECVYIDR